VVAGSALAGVRSARASTPVGSELSFLFVVNYGGWDTTRVFAPLFGTDGIDMESEAETATAGGIAYVDHPDRPSVREFFDGWHARSLMVNGILVPSVAHPASLRRLMTGGTSDGLGDWPAMIAAARADAYTLPHIVVSGPSYPGVYGEVVCRTGTNGQLAALLAGDLYTRGDLPTSGPSAAAESRLDRYVSERAAKLLDRAVASRDRELLQGVVAGLSRGEGLKGTLGQVDWTNGSTFAEQAALAVDVLALGLSRCVTVSYELETWDTHVANELQSGNFEGLFGELVALMRNLDATPGSLGGSMAEQTVVVVVSEMARAPTLNDSEGKDHWPYTSALLVGPGLTTDRVIGGWDDAFFGLPVDLASGEVDADGGDDVGSEAVGAALLALADIDPHEARPGTTVLDGALEA
jgi:hypothetical protein